MRYNRQNWNDKLLPSFRVNIPAAVVEAERPDKMGQVQEQGEHCKRRKRTVLESSQYFKIDEL